MCQSHSREAHYHKESRRLAKIHSKIIWRVFSLRNPLLCDLKSIFSQWLDFQVLRLAVAPTMASLFSLPFGTPWLFLETGRNPSAPARASVLGLLSGVSPHNCPPNHLESAFSCYQVMAHVKLLEENTARVVTPIYYIAHFMPLISKHLSQPIQQKEQESTAWCHLTKTSA